MKPPTSHDRPHTIGLLGYRTLGPRKGSREVIEEPSFTANDSKLADSDGLASESSLIYQNIIEYAV